MKRSRSDRAHPVAAGLALLFIVYASLYPWRFHKAAPLEAVKHLLANPSPWQQNAAGLIANIALYLPLGLFAAASLRSRCGRAAAIVLTTIIGALVCVALEYLQFFDASRISTLADAYTNIAGAFIGAVMGVVFAGYSSDWARLGRLKDAAAILLLLVFAAYRLFPYVPSVSLQTYWHAIKPIVIHPEIGYLAVFQYGVLWCTVAALAGAAFGARVADRGLLAAMSGLLALQIAIVHNTVALSEVVAMPIALIVWYALPRQRPALTYAIIAGLLSLVVLADRLLPFDWQPVGHSFGWIPFHSIMHGSMAVNTLAILEKLFTYASLIWLLRRAGLGALSSAGLVIAALFATSWVEIHLPGRSAEITDALIALLCALLLRLLQAVGAPSTQNPRRKNDAALVGQG